MTSGAQQRITISDRRWAWFVSFCRLTDRDLRILELARPPEDLLVRAADAVVQHLAEYPEFRVLVQSTSSLTALHERVREYADSLFTGRFDDERLAQLVRIGVTHDRIGLPVAAFLGTTLTLNTTIAPALAARFESQPEMLTQLPLSCTRLMACDFGIVTQTALDVRERMTSRLEQSTSHGLSGHRLI